MEIAMGPPEPVPVEAGGGGPKRSGYREKGVALELAPIHTSHTHEHDDDERSQ
jgi:hypothetical protein